MLVGKNFAEEVTDFAKCLTIGSLALQVVVVCASPAETGMEIKGAKVEGPAIYARLEDLLETIEKSMIPVLHPDRLLDKLLVKNVCKVQRKLTYLCHWKRTTQTSHFMRSNPLR